MSQELYLAVKSGQRSLSSLNEDEKNLLRSYMGKPTTSQQDKTWTDTMATRNNRKIIGGIDPALTNVKEPITSKIGRWGGAAAMSVGEEATRIGALGSDLLMAPYDLVMGKVNPDYENNPYTKGVMPRSKGLDELWKNTTEPVKQSIGLKDTTAEQVIGGLAGFIPSIAVSGGLTKATGLLPTIEKAGEKISAKLGGKLAGKAANSVVKSSPDMVNTWLMMEGNKPEEERIPFAEWAAMWAGSELALKGVGAGLKAGLGKIKGRSNPPSVVDDVIPEDMDWVPEETLNSGEYSWKKPILALPEGKGGEPYSNIPNWEFGTGKIDPEYQSKYSVKPLPRPASLNRNVDVASLSDSYSLPDVGNLEGRALANRTKQEQLALPGSNPLALPEPFKPNWEIGRQPTQEEIMSALAKQQKEMTANLQGERQSYPRIEAQRPSAASTPPVQPKLTPEQELQLLVRQQRETVNSAQGQPGGGARSNVVVQPSPDPVYLKELEGKYNTLINEEIASMKEEIGGVTKYMPDEQNGPLLRASLNSKWYRDFWDKNNRAPREGEYRDMAIKNLIEGVESDIRGSVPANDEFRMVLSELSRGSKLPEEWHGLQKSIGEVAATDAGNQADTGIKSLVDDMLAEQKRIEPYGAQRDMGRLNDVEGQYRNLLKDKMDYGQEYPAENGIAKFKYATSTAKKATNDANKAFDIDVKDADRISLDEPAMSRPDMQLADKVANALSGTSIITAKMPSFMSKVQGFFVQDGKKIFLNSNMDDPATYVTLHEAGHKMEAEYPDEYGKMLEIAVNNLKDDHKALIERYQGRGYEIEDMPSEFFNDLMAEMLHDKSFIGRLHDQAPEVIKPLLQVLDDLIAKVKLALSKDDSVLPFIQDLERLRFEMAPEYQNYLKTVGEQPGNKFRKGWQAEGIAAKQGEISEAGIVPGDTNAPEFKKWFGDSKVVDKQGNPLVVYHGTDKEINSFIPREAPGWGKGIYFATSPEGITTHLSKDITNIIPSYVNIKKPYRGGIIPEKEIKNSPSWNKYIEEKRQQLISDGYMDADEPIGNMLVDQYDIFQENSRLLNTVIRELGYDGVIVENPDYGQEVVVFFPEQIKSIYNRGTWDPTNPDIRFKMSSNQPSSTPLQNVKNLVMSSTTKLGNGNLKYGEWSKQMLAEHGSGVEKNLPYIWHRSQEMLTNGTTTIKIGEQEMPVTMPNRQAKSNLPGQKEKGAQGQDWNHVATKTDKSSVTVKGVANKVYETAFDDLNRLNQVDKEAYMQALNSREAGGVAKNIVEKGLADSQGNIIGESLKSITKQIPKGAANDFDNYLIYRHAPSWLEQGRKVFPDDEGITADVARQRAAAYEQAHPEFKELGDKIVKWQRDLGKAWLVDTGIIKPEAWAKMQEMYPDYIPFQRKMQEIETMPGSGKAKGKFANQSNPVKKAEGSQREIISPIESMIEHVEKYVKTAKRNEVMQTMHKNIQKDPEAFKGLIEIMPEKGKTFESVFAKDGMDGFINWMEEPFAQMKARKNMEYDKPNVVRGIVNGETVHLKVNDPALLDTLATLSPQGQNNVIEFFRQGTRIMKVLTTGGNPIFATRNIARDLPMAYIASDTLVKTPILREVQFVWGMLDSFARIVTNGRYDPGSYYKTFKAMGGGTHSSSMAADRNLLAESKASVLPGYFDLKKPITGAGRGIKAAGRGIEQFTNAVETAPRLPEYIRTVKQGGDTYASRQKGLFNAQDVTVNFSRHGSVAKDADAFVPYLNAALQGIDKLGRIYSKDPIGAVYRSVVAVTVPAIGLWLINRDDPNYQKLSSWTRDNYFCIPLESGKFLKIAKPREAGVVFGSMAERALDKWANDDPNGFKGFSEAWIHSFAPPVRTIGAPVTDVIANKNFAGAPIVPGYMQRLSPEQQHDENTSAPAKALGKLTNSSPKKIDYLARSYTGVLGELGIPAASEGRGESAVQRIGNVLDKTFKADPLYSNDTLGYFYDAKDKLDTATSDFNATKIKGESYNPAKSKIMNAASTKISDINKQIRATNSNGNMSYEAKDARVRSLKQKSLDIADQALRRIGEVK